MDAQGGRAAAALRRRERSREQILKAASRLFTERGYRLATVAAVAAAAQVGPATVYNRFGTKGAIVAHLLEPRVAALREAVRHDLAGALPCREAVGRHVGRLAAAIDLDRPLWEAFFDAMCEARRQPPALPEHDPLLVAPLTEVLGDVLEAARAGGELRPDLDAAGIAADMTWLLMFHCLYRLPHTEATMGIFLHGMAPRGLPVAAAR